MAVLIGGMGAWQAAGYPVTKRAPKDVPRDPKSLYARHCATCHQLDGRGVTGSYPSLQGNGLVVMSDPRALLLVMLNGLYPERTPERPNPAKMPGFSQLSDEDLAAIATHVRASFDNHAGPVTPAQVKAMRGKP